MKPEPNEITRLVKAVSPTGKEAGSALRVHEWTDEQRTSRAWRRLLTWWGCALGAAICPPHLPWFTIGFLGGPIAAWFAWHVHGTVLEQKIACPDCGALTTIEEQSTHWPIGARCEPCRRVFSVTQAMPAANT